jgi:hypothetical protein
MRSWVAAFVLVAACGGDAQGARHRDGGELVDAAFDAAWQHGLDSALGADASPPDPESLFWFVPSDRSVVGFDAALGVSIYHYGFGQSPEVVLQNLSGSLELIEWPSRNKLDYTVSYDSSKPPYAMQVSLTPSAPLSAGEYALRLSPMPPGVRPGTSGVQRIDGVLTSRFSVDGGSASEP